MNILEKKYKKYFSKFFKYFRKNFIKIKPFSSWDWNYNKIIHENEDENIYFFTNNIVESTNRTINLHHGGNIKSILSFKNCIIELLGIFNKKKVYQNNKLSITRALAFYTNKDDFRIQIIDLNKFKYILLDYKEFLKKKLTSLI